MKKLSENAERVDNEPKTVLTVTGKHTVHSIPLQLRSRRSLLFSISQLFVGLPFMLFFRVAEYSEIDTHHYLTLSRDGMMSTCDGETEFTPLSRWRDEYIHYQQLVAKKTFWAFRLWKAFSCWHTTVKLRWELIKEFGTALALLWSGL